MEQNVQIVPAPVKSNLGNFPLWVKFLLSYAVLGFVPGLLISLFLIRGYESILRDAGDQGLAEKIATFHLNAGLLFGFLSALLLAGTFVVIRVFTAPIAKLVGWIRDAHQKGFSGIGDAPIISADEVGELAQEINDAIKYFHEVGEREKAVSKAKNEFISIAAHQLRTPLTSIRWALQSLLAKEAAGTDARRLAEISFSSTERLIYLINDLLNANSIEEGKFGFTFIQADLNPVLEQAVSELQPLAESRKIKLRVLKTPVSDNVFMDPSRISLVLSNLLSNAINYTSPGGSVIVKTSHQGDMIEVAVEDTGIGMSVAEKERLFTKFFRGKDAIRLHPDGSGLGLFVVKNIVDRHGGTIRIESEEGRGTAFFFTLPVHQSKLAKGVPFERFFQGI